METNDFDKLWQSTPSADGGGKDFELIEQGKYVAVIEEAKYDMTSQPNKVSVTLKITGSCDGEQCDTAGRKTWLNYNMSDKGIPWFKKDLETLKIDHASLRSVDDVASALDTLKGAMVEIYVKHTADKKNPSKVYANAYLNNLIEKPSTSELAF